MWRKVVRIGSKVDISERKGVKREDQRFEDLQLEVEELHHGTQEEDFAKCHKNQASFLCDVYLWQEVLVGEGERGDHAQIEGMWMESDKQL